MAFIEALSPWQYRIRPGFVPGMHVPGEFYLNARLKDLLFEELQVHCERGGHGGFLPAVKQIANVAALPGVVQVRGWVGGCAGGWVGGWAGDAGSLRAGADCRPLTHLPRSPAAEIDRAA